MPLSYAEAKASARAIGSTVEGTEAEYDAMRANLEARARQQIAAMIDHLDDNGLPVAGSFRNPDYAFSVVGFPRQVSDELVIIIEVNGWVEAQNVVWLGMNEQLSETSATRFYDNRPHGNGSRFPVRDPVELKR